MGVISTVLGFFGFGFGLSAGIVIGYFFFIYVQPTDVKVGTFPFGLLSFLLYIIFLHYCIMNSWIVDNCFADMFPNYFLRDL
jgi:hypothetical protein